MNNIRVARAANIIANAQVENVLLYDGFDVPSLDTSIWNTVVSSGGYSFGDGIIKLEGGSTLGGGTRLYTKEYFTIANYDTFTLEARAQWKTRNALIGFQAWDGGHAFFGHRRFNDYFSVAFREDEETILEVPISDVEADTWHTFKFVFSNDKAYLFVDDALKHVQEDYIPRFEPMFLTISQGASDDGGERLMEVDYIKITSQTNVAPEVGPISAPLDPVPVNTVVEASAEFTDIGDMDAHTTLWDQGDGSSPTEGTIIEEYGSGSMAGEHTYTQPGVYTVHLTVSDSAGSSGESVFQYVVVYDPDGGFVTGGGWIWSPEGAYTPYPTLTGKATFGFVSKYQKGADVPTGNTEFQFKVADLNFKSTSYDWLVIAGTKAIYKGTGTINGEGKYGFMLSAIDGTPDKFRIKIWDNANDAVVYDNQLGAVEDAEPATELGGGSIVVHKK